MGNPNDVDKNSGKQEKIKLNREILFKTDDSRKLEKKRQFIENEIAKIKREQTKMQADLVVNERELKKVLEEDMMLKQIIIKMRRELGNIR